MTIKSRLLHLLFELDSSTDVWLYQIQAGFEVTTKEQLSWKGSGCTLWCYSIDEENFCQSFFNGPIFLFEALFKKLNSSLCQTITGW